MLNVQGLKGLTEDSRAVEPGFLFAALPGSKADGRDFIPAAIEKGATVILAPEGTKLPRGASAELITASNPRKKFAKIAAAYYNAQPDHVAAITGTNGKTSTALFTAQLWAALGYGSASMGTLGIHGAGVDKPGKLTTPGTAELHAELAELSKSGITHLALEASSHGLDQYRLDGVKVELAAFTNLSRDHLDYHKDMEEYLAAKARLFSEILLPEGTAVLNADVPEFEHLNFVCETRKLRVISYGEQGEQIELRAREVLPGGQRLTLSINGEAHTITLPLVGSFQAMNALCALGLVLAKNEEQLPEILKALEKIKGAPGRLEPVIGHPSGAAIYVDYAHTPDALENVLTALRPHTHGKLVCLFGCGGDRDKGKRAQMAEIASALADHVIVTDDNPRSEDPAAIRAEILMNAPEAQEIEGRASAILAAVEILSAGDVLIVAGKGHEQGQIFKDRTDPFDDRTEVQKAIHNLTSKTHQKTSA